MKYAWKMKWYEKARRWLVNHARDNAPENHPRRWSNREIRRLGTLFKGRIVNVSGWRDEDKEGGHYRNYFPNAESYGLTNYWGTGVPNDGAAGAVFLDLQSPLPEALHDSCEVAFSHTVLEHIGNVELAMRNIGAMTTDAALIVVPWMQDEHYRPGIFGDYWRFSPLGMQRLMGLVGLEMVYCEANDQPWYPVYLVAVGTKKPEVWKDQFSELDWNRRLGRNQYGFPGSIW